MNRCAYATLALALLLAGCQRAAPLATPAVVALTTQPVTGPAVESIPLSEDARELAKLVGAKLYRFRVRSNGFEKGRYIGMFSEAGRGMEGGNGPLGLKESSFVIDVALVPIGTNEWTKASQMRATVSMVTHPDGPLPSTDAEGQSTVLTNPYRSGVFIESSSPKEGAQPFTLLSVKSWSRPFGSSEKPDLKSDHWFKLVLYNNPTEYNTKSPHQD